MDPRYLYHTNLYFIDCDNNGCVIYLQRKNNVNYYPQLEITYKINH